MPANPALTEQLNLFPMATFAVAGLMLGALLILIIDAIDMVRCLDQEHSWYSASWMQAPARNLYFAWQDSREYTTQNAIGSEVWRVRETKVGETIFWTILQSDPVRRIDL